MANTDDDFKARIRRHMEENADILALLEESEQQDRDIDYERDWAGECRLSPGDGNGFLLRALSGEQNMDGTWTFHVKINDIMGGHERWLPASEWVKWEEA
jgi:hypothetical protein